jgi:NtrC-family two-component system sensor histidine kinase KinB
MTLSLRQRIVLTVLPFAVLLTIVGCAAVVLLYRLGGSIDRILRENYASVIAMEHLNDSLERIDSSFQFALAGKERKARQQYEENWPRYYDSLKDERGNITLPGERELVEQLTDLTERYRQQGEAFYRRPENAVDQRRGDYFGEPAGLLDSFKQIKHVSGEILRINQQNMEEASRESRGLAASSLVWFAAGSTAALLVAGLLAFQTMRAVLRPIQAVTHSAVGIGLGNLDQVVPVMSRDELGELAKAFNTMARQLREYRQTSYSRLLRAQRTSQATIDAFPDPVLVVDSQGQVELVNPAARRIFGAAAQAGEPTTPVPWQPPEAIRQPLAEALHQQRSYLPDGFERALVLPLDDQEHFFLPHVLPIRDPYGNTLGAAVQLQDVTRFRLLDQVKSDLVATVSHELKTPLTSLRLALHLLLEETLGPLTPKQTELLLDARDSAERLLARVNNLLDLARLERGQIQLDPVPASPAELLRAAAETAHPRALDKGVVISVETPGDLPLVSADVQRLGHALGNLLDNALTYTERGGRISLSAFAADDSVTLTVTDTGIGIPPEYLPRLFDRFFRVPDQSKGSGTGLGLAIVREIMTAHGGTVSCASTPGAETTFRLTLPVWVERSAARDSDSPSGPAASALPVGPISNRSVPLDGL